jgi:hypothetical protein
VIQINEASDYDARQEVYRMLVLQLTDIWFLDRATKEQIIRSINPFLYAELSLDNNTFGWDQLQASGSAA